ncbi:MAG: MFS transporter [Bacteroidota bacterium]|nr:MFS transporter [Bacteroidota bacterium]
MKKPKLSFWQIWNMNVGFFGIQFGFALQNANVSRIFETLGAKIEQIPILWIAAPVTGLIIQPIIGYFSDKTWGKLGRRRPYFLIGAILASISLIFMPHSSALWIAAGMLWIMDASINVSMEPFRAFVGDMLPNEQRTLGFSMQSFFIGTGAVIASFLPYIFTNWLDIPNTAPEGQIPPSVKYAFYLGAIIFIAAVTWTVFSSKEYSPEEMEKFKEDLEKSKENETIDKNAELKKSKTIGSVAILVGITITSALYIWKVSGEVYIFGLGLIVFGLLEFFNYWLISKEKHKNGFSSVITDLNNMPKTMKQLAIVQFFSWFALFAMWIYATPAITEHVFGSTDTTSSLYNNGADWVGVLFGMYNGAAAILAFALIGLAKITNRKMTHAFSLLIGGISLASIYFIQGQYALLIPFAGIGLVWASVLSMPYAILTGSLPSKKMGTYMGIFNFFIVIPQILAASILGFFVKNLFNEKAIYALLLGGASFIIAALLVIFVEDKSGKKLFKKTQKNG